MKAHLPFVSLLAGAFAVSGAEFCEDFHAAPALSEGWTYGDTTNAKLGSYSGEGSPNVDRKTALAGGFASLKIERASDKGGPVAVEMLSPTADEDIREYSLFFRRSSTSGTACVEVSGFSLRTSEWMKLGQVTATATTGLFETNRVAAADRIRQVKFVFTDIDGTGPTCALDSLRILTGADLPSGGDDPAEPTAPTNLKLEATAPDAIEATWQGVPGTEGYRVERYRPTDARETEVPDFSGLKEGTWPAGWTHSDGMGFGSYVDGATCNVKILYDTAWIASPCYPRPVTSFSYKFRSNSSNADEMSRTKLVVETSATETGDDWQEFERQAVAGGMTTVNGKLDSACNVRRLRFSVSYGGEDRKYAANLLLEFRVLSVTCGQATAELEESVTTDRTVLAFSGLDGTASYYVTVRPEPSDDPALVATSAVVDLSKEHFRRTGARSVTERALKYEERFDSLSNFVSNTKAGKIDLDSWQFVLNGAEMDSLRWWPTNLTQTAAGCYVCRDEEKIVSVDSSMIGTLAGGDKECAVGLAWTNEVGRTLPGVTVTFDSVQRNFKTNPASYALEWRVADGETSIAAAGDWRSVDIPTTAPLTAETCGGRTEFRQDGICVAIPAKVPAGKTFLLRWRHPKTTSGPLMAVDNVCVAFDRPRGFVLVVR